MSTAPRLVLASAGRASDAAYLAAADLVPARETADADFGAAYPVIADPRLLAALRERGYQQQSGNRFLRTHTPATSGDTAPRWDLVIDVLAPSYTGRLLPNQPHGELVVDEVPGLYLALARDGTPVTVEVTLTSGDTVTTELMLPDVVSAICLKAYAYAGRLTARDAVDLWRLLEAAFTAGITAASWPTGPATAEAASMLHRHFGRPGAPGLARASDNMPDRTRIATPVRHVIGPR